MSYNSGQQCTNEHGIPEESMVLNGQTPQTFRLFQVIQLEFVYQIRTVGRLQEYTSMTYHNILFHNHNAHHKEVRY